MHLKGINGEPLAVLICAIINTVNGVKERNMKNNCILDIFDVAESGLHVKTATKPLYTCVFSIDQPYKMMSLGHVTFSHL